MPVQVAKWDSARDAWMDEGHISLFSELSDAFLGTFPTSGMTVNGVAYELPTWEPATDASGSSSSPDAATLEYLGTPTSRMWKGAGPAGGPTQIRNKARGLIEAQVMDIQPRMLPTPTVSDTTGPGAGPNKTGGDNLRTAVSLLPTPKASDGEKGGPNQRGSSGDYPLPAIGHLLPTPVTQPETGNGHARNLGKEAKLLRTPCAAEASGGPRNPSRPGATMRLSDQVREKLLPTTRAQHGEDRNQNIYPRPLDQPQNLENSLARLPGATTSLLSDAGNEPLDEPLPGQPSLLDAITGTD